MPPSKSSRITDLTFDTLWAEFWLAPEYRHLQCNRCENSTEHVRPTFPPLRKWMHVSACFTTGFMWFPLFCLITFRDKFRWTCTQCGHKRGVFARYTKEETFPEPWKDPWFLVPAALFIPLTLLFWSWVGGLVWKFPADTNQRSPQHITSQLPSQRITAQTSASPPVVEELSVPFTPSTISTGIAPPPAQKSAKEIIADNLTLDTVWYRGGFDSLLFADFTITNKSSSDVKDLEIVCTSSAPSGTSVDKNDRVIYDIVHAKSTKVIKKFSMGFLHSQATRTGCAIRDFQVN